MGCYVRNAHPIDAFEIAPFLRVADRNELEVMDPGSDPLMALLESIELSDWSLAVCADDDDRVLGLLGVAPSGVDGIGHPWFLGTDDLTKHQVSFLRGSLGIVKLMHRAYHTLTNVMDARNALHFRWLHWLGFTFPPGGRHKLNGYVLLTFIRSDTTACAT